MGRALNSITAVEDKNNKVYASWDAVLDRYVQFSFSSVYTNNLLLVPGPLGVSYMSKIQ